MNPSEFILKRINRYFQKISWDSHNELLGDVGYRYIPAPIDFIYQALNVINDKEGLQGKRFLDVGSGVGNICGIAAQMGCKAEGIELNPVLSNISKELFPEVLIHSMNIFDFNNYQDYDIIFYFYPIQDDNLESKLKTIIEDNAKVGAYIIVEIEEQKDDRFISIDFNNAKSKLWYKVR